ncbi:hypothetical protein [Dongia sp.]|uniref:hypothetical protein n=1 Tax=Dongia sp. TaxID=1977262 RepID=UPI0035B4CC68
MGVIVTAGNLVSLSDNHNQCVNTDIRQRVHRLHFNIAGSIKFEITYLFSRHPGGKSGDAAALLHAMKGSRDYCISRSDTLTIAQRAISLGIGAIQGKYTDALIPMPTTSEIVSRCCRYASARMSGRPPIAHALRKRSVEELLEVMPPVSAVSPGVRADYASFRRRLTSLDRSATIAMKHIPVRLRRFVPLITAEMGETIRKMTRVIIVDDVISTGSSF